MGQLDIYVSNGREHPDAPHPPGALGDSRGRGRLAHSRSNFLGFWSRGAWEARGFRTPVGRFEECQRLFYGIGLGLGIQVLTPNRPFWVGEVRSRFWKMFRSHFCRKLAQIRPEFRLTGSETEPNLGPLIPKNGSPQEPLEITMTLPQTPPPLPRSPQTPRAALGCSLPFKHPHFFLLPQQIDNGMFLGGLCLSSFRTQLWYQKLLFSKRSRVLRLLRRFAK